MSGPGAPTAHGGRPPSRGPSPAAGFWASLPRPVWALAPMEDVTDTVLRRLLRRWGGAVHSHGESPSGPGGASPGWSAAPTGMRGAGTGSPAVMFTEFTRVDAPMRAVQGYEPGRLRYTEEERPIVAQLWGTRPEEFYRAARALAELGFDGIDLNFGCPVKKIRAAGACSALIANRPLAAEIVAAVREGGPLPVSAKTRIGLDEPETEEWCGFLLEQGLAALTVHGRIAARMSEDWADWREVARVVRLRDAIAPTTLILGNGDVRSLQHGRRLVDQTGVDGVMVGRGIFWDPLLFGRTSHSDAPQPTDDPWGATPLPLRLDYLEAHIREWHLVWGERRNWEILKKFFRNYLRGDHSGLLERLYAAVTVDEALRAIAAFRTN